MNCRRMKLVIAILLAQVCASAGVLDNAWIKGTTDKNPLSYKPGEEMVFTLEPQGIEGELPEGEFTLWWKRSDDYGATDRRCGSTPFVSTALGCVP